MGCRRFVALLIFATLLSACATPDTKPRFYKGEPFSPDVVFRKIGLSKQDVVADLAWADGSAAIAAARFGLDAWAYPDNYVGVFRAKFRARSAGVSEKVHVEMLKHGVSLRDANIVFYSPSSEFGPVDLLAAIKKNAARSGKIISTQRLQIRGIVGFELMSEANGLLLYRWGPEQGVRDTVPPPQDVIYPVPPKPTSSVPTR